MGIARIALWACAAASLGSACGGVGGTFKDASGVDGGGGGPAGSDGGAPDQGAADSPVDRGVDRGSPDAPAVDGPRPDAGCVAPAGAPGATCVPGLVGLAGWKYVSYEQGGVGCPPSYENPSEVVVAGGPAMCGCACSGGAVSCTGHVSLYYNSAVGSAGCPGTLTVTSSAPCVTTSIPVAGALKAVAPSPTATPCSGMATTKTPKDIGGRVCRAKVGAGCRMGEVCVPTATPANLCVWHDKDVPCPPGAFTKYRVASGFTDTRDCGACTCNATGAIDCSNPEIHLFTDSACTKSPSTTSTVPADGVTCTALANSTVISSIDFTATPLGGGCMPGGPPTPTGGETPISPQTLCCK